MRRDLDMLKKLREQLYDEPSGLRLDVPEMVLAT